MKLRFSRFLLYAIIALLWPSALAQRPKLNYDEAKVPPYTLPDVLTFEDGAKVANAGDWTRRRAELLKLFATHIYGKTPGGRPREMRFRTMSVRKDALGGKAIRKEVSVLFTGKSNGPKMDLLIYLPAGVKKPSPAFLGLNFAGNQSVHPDAEITISTAWMRAEQTGVVNHRATEQSRGSEQRRWPIEAIIARGYAVVTAYYGDLAPDYDAGFRSGVQALFPRPTPAAPDEWGAIGAWAWGLSRALDYLESDAGIDARQVIVHGHSRLAKAALWAGAQDQRFAVVIANESGCMGAALSKRIFGNTVAGINQTFPYWFCDNFRKYNDHEAALPVDQHQLLALIAPRPLYVTSAREDLLADPQGEFLGALHASVVWKFLGRDGLPAREMPPVHQPSVGTVAYHIRTGKHDITDYDWEQYLAFGDRLK
ncbi:MAG: alpha/beta hydrolase family protein [Blastocatellia bacterium]